MKIEIPRKIIKQISILLLFLSSFNCAKSQSEPAWMVQAWRAEQYPANVFITGFAQDNKKSKETLAEATERLKNLARANLSTSILASVKSVSENYIQSVLEGESESIKEKFEYQTNISTDLEINGIHAESYSKNNTVYGFAFANKYEIIGYYKANLNMQVQQIEGLINTAVELEQKREKSKAKAEFNKTLPIFIELTKAQGILSAVDKNISDDDLKMQKTMELYNEVVQANARLAQGILVYIVSSEDLFGEEINSLENSLKAILAVNDCSFTIVEEEADWKLHIRAKSREYNYSNKIYFSYVDAEVQLFKAPSDKHVYQNEISNKGGHSLSYKAAAKIAYEEISDTISKEILKWINN